MAFGKLLEQAIPGDLPQRERLLELAAKHLKLVEAANRTLNLTAITDPKEAVIKHVYDAVVPWRRLAPYEFVLDLGSGAGFPGLPLAAILCDKQFLLAESVKKKAQFLESAVRSLGLSNVEVVAERGEQILRRRPAPLIIARAVGSVRNLLRCLGKAPEFERLLLYKGPNAAAEIQQAAKERQKLGLEVAETMHYALPAGMGQRVIVELFSRRGRGTF